MLLEKTKIGLSTWCKVLTIKGFHKKKITFVYKVNY